MGRKTGQLSTVGSEKFGPLRVASGQPSRQKKGVSRAGASVTLPPTKPVKAFPPRCAPVLPRSPGRLKPLLGAGAPVCPGLPRLPRCKSRGVPRRGGFFGGVHGVSWPLLGRGLPRLRLSACRDNRPMPASFFCVRLSGPFGCRLCLMGL